MPFDFAAFVEKQIRAVGGKAVDLARDWSVNEMDICRWRSGTRPRLDKILPILERKGSPLTGAFSRVAEDPATYRTAPSIKGVPLYGQVSAGDTVELGQDHGTVVVPEQLWTGSPHWAHTRGPVRYLEVQGTSMAPRYRPGDLIACRAPDRFSLKHLRGAHVVLQPGDADAYSFKVLQFTANGDPVGVPLNPEAPVIIARSEDEPLNIVAVAIGRIEGGTVIRKAKA